MNLDQYQRYAFLCEHVASGEQINLAFSEGPSDDGDSGWQFFCNRGPELVDNAKIWKLGEVIAFEPSLTEFLELKPPFKLVRSTVTNTWTIESWSGD